MTETPNKDTARAPGDEPLADPQLEAFARALAAAVVPDLRRWPREEELPDDDSPAHA